LESNGLIEEVCPICNKEIRSDANIHTFCQLCGMGILDIALAPKYKNQDGRNYYFCCENCRYMYKKEIL
jgi:YHS domain-containing protein